MGGYQEGYYDAYVEADKILGSMAVGERINQEMLRILRIFNKAFT